MNSDTAISVEHLSKRYLIGGKQRQWTIRDSIDEFIHHPFGIGKENQESQEFWALTDVSFDIKRGDVVGVIGRNGSGKSTLLKILSRIVEPTKGKVTMRGRVASLLEVGTGFNPELTGRENIFLNGAILGMSRAEIASKFDEIVAFSGVEKFIDTPVKRYSSGMYVRLAFAVAAHLDSDILLVDEVLAVGDQEFQKKCLGKMKALAGGGKTVLFVSHNEAAIRQLCNQGVLLERGNIITAGRISNVLKEYLNHSEIIQSHLQWKNNNEISTQNMNRIESITIENLIDSKRDYANLVDSICLKVVYRVMRDEMLNISLSVFRNDNEYVFASPSSTPMLKKSRSVNGSLFSSECIVPRNLFNEGLYSFNVVLVKNGTEIIHEVRDEVVIRYIDSNKQLNGNSGTWGGCMRPLLEWTEHQIQ